MSQKVSIEDLRMRAAGMNGPFGGFMGDFWLYTGRTSGDSGSFIDQRSDYYWRSISDILSPGHRLHAAMPAIYEAIQQVRLLRNESH